MNFVRDIETTLPIETIKVRNRQVWPYLRIAYYFEFVSRDFGVDASFGLFKKIIQNLYKMKKVFTGLLHWFRQYDFIIFSCSQEMRKIEDKYADKLIFPLYGMVDKNKILYVERGASGIPQKQRLESNIVFTGLIDFLAVVITLFTRTYKIENENIFKEIQKKYSIKLNWKSYISLFLAYEKIFKIYLKIARPKVVFVTEYYNIAHMALISACKSSKIKTIEIQHGLVSEDYASYCFYNKKLSDFVCPDYIFVYGRIFVDTVKNFSYVPLERILTVGHAYLDYKLQSNSKMKLQTDRKIVIVTLQDLNEHIVIPFLIEAARDLEEFEIVLLPRTYDPKKYSAYSLPKNVTFDKKNGFYDWVGSCHIHATVHSACAYEAPSFGKPNIIIDQIGTSSGYFENLLEDKQNNILVQSVEQFVEACNKLKNTDEGFIKSKSNYFIEPNFNLNFKKILKENLKIQTL